MPACTLPAVEGGNNGNDRSQGGDQGEELLTGAMVVSPDGKYALMQRNATSVLFDVERQTARELPVQVDRFVFAKDGSFGVAVLANRADVVAYELPAATERWRARPAFQTYQGATLAKLSDDGQHFVVGDVDRVLVLDAKSGAMRDAVRVGSRPEELAFVPGSGHALVVGQTRWTDHKPATEVVDIDLSTLGAQSIQVPNCTAPLSVAPDGSRAFLSPTFCEETKPATGQQTWTNPDPVSVIDIGPKGSSFVKNLPGFGPVAMDASGSRVVAYLDMQRIDESMFADKSQIPPATGPRYHILRIDPKTLAFDLSPIGNVLPRFALGKDGKTLLVDATVQRLRGEVTFKASIDANGRVTASFELFGKTDALFGAFDLEKGAYAPFQGDTGALDRFVQMGDAQRVFTLKTRLDGMGGDLYRIDLGDKSVKSLGKSLRDIGLLADGKTLLLRERLPALQVSTEAGIDWYRRERYCLSLDGLTCISSFDYQDPKPFKSGSTCADYHDC